MQRRGWAIPQTRPLQRREAEEGILQVAPGAVRLKALVAAQEQLDQASTVAIVGERKRPIMQRHAR